MTHSVLLLYLLARTHPNIMFVPYVYQGTMFYLRAFPIIHSFYNYFYRLTSTMPKGGSEQEIKSYARNFSIQNRESNMITTCGMVNHEPPFLKVSHFSKLSSLLPMSLQSFQVSVPPSFLNATIIGIQGHSLFHSSLLPTKIPIASMVLPFSLFYYYKPDDIMGSSLSITSKSLVDKGTPISQVSIS